MRKTGKTQAQLSAEVAWRGVLMQLVACKLFDMTSIVEKLMHIEFDKSGEFVRNKAYSYATKHFPSVIRLWEEEVNNGKDETNTHTQSIKEGRRTGRGNKKQKPGKSNRRTARTKHNATVSGS